MKKTIFLKIMYFVFFLSGIAVHSQNFKPFTTRFDANVKGDMLLIGNNILNRNLSPDDSSVPYNGTGLNSDFNMNYIDIDNDPSTFSSSSAELDLPVVSNCYRIVHAGLYWAATLQSGSRVDINKVKLKLPTGGYNDIIGEIIYDANATPIGTDAMKPYTCYADVTSLVNSLTNPEGTYMVANVLSSEGSLANTGLSAGWTLFIVYEDPTLTQKSIVSFDGFSGIGGATTLDISINGFRTIPVGPVKAKFAFTALEGDQSITGDYLRINGATISTPQRIGSNFFNSSLTTAGGYFTTRTPNSSNNLGFDAGILGVSNPMNALIGNNATSATIRLGSAQDAYYYYFNAFAVDIVAPKIELTNTVENSTGVNITGSQVNMNENFYYNISFQNTGNDDVSSLIIKDFIPVNIIFNPADLILPQGVTYTYNPTTREIIFTIPDNLVEVGDPVFAIKIKGQVPSSCQDFIASCSSTITNQAFASYSGIFNPSVHTDESSFSSLDCGATSTPTIVTVNVSSCNFQSNATICETGNAILEAANNYLNYVWSGPGTITSVPGTNNQSVIVTQPGTYTVNDIANSSSCASILQTFIVNSCYPLNTVIQNGNRLYALENNATYQWIDCDNGNQPITGETSQFFEPSLSGNYAVIVTNAANYQVTSACIPFTFLGIQEIEKFGLKLYPNPTSDKFFISGDIAIKTVSIYNLLGQKIMTFGDNKKEYDINKLQLGTYIVKIQTESGTVIARIIKN